MVTRSLWNSPPFFHLRPSVSHAAFPSPAEFLAYTCTTAAETTSERGRLFRPCRFDLSLFSPKLTPLNLAVTIQGPIMSDLHSSSSAVVDHEATADDAQTTVVTCPRCGTAVDWNDTEWCLQCGYFPRYEGEIEPSAAPRDPVKAGLPWEEDVSFRLAPWAVVLATGVFGIFVASGYIGYAYSANAHFRAWWTLSQIFTGTAAVTIAHFTAFFFASIVNGEKVGVMDWLMKPIYIWFSTFTVLPKRAWSVWLAGWGMTSVFAAMALIGGVRYSAIFDDWGFVPHAQANLVQEIVERAKQAEGGNQDDLEEAMKDFTGEEEGTGEEDNRNWVEVECLIIGYTPRSDRDFNTLLLATRISGTITFIGTIPAEKIPVDVREKLLVRMRQLDTFRPIIKVPQAAKWVKPQLMCRVKDVDWLESKPALMDPKFDKLLQELPLQR